MESTWKRESYASFLGMLVFFASCNGGGMERALSKGNAASGYLVPRDGDANPKGDPNNNTTTSPGAGSGGNVSTGPGTSGGTIPGQNGTNTNTNPGNTTTIDGISSLLLDECTARKQAWPAVIGGLVSKTCTDPLVNFCCTRADVKAQFPTLVDDLERYFQQIVDADRMVLYHCSMQPDASSVGAYKYVMHLGKVVGTSLTYQTISVTGANPSGAAAVSIPCPVVKAVDLKRP